MARGFLMSAPRSLPVGLEKYAARMSPGSAFGVVREYNGKKTPPHNGCDFPTPVGVPLEATITGKVSLVGGSPTHVWGYYVHLICDCPRKHVVEYHILRDKPAFKIGQRVNVGDLIGHTGRSGSLNGKGYSPHHHHGTSENGRYFNPLSIGWPKAADTVSTPFDEPIDEDDMYSDQDRAVAAETVVLLREAVRLLENQNNPVLVKTARSSKVWLSDLVVRRLVATQDELNRVTASLQSRSLSSVVSTVDGLDAFGIPVLTDAQRKSLTQAQIDGDA